MHLDILALEKKLREDKDFLNDLRATLNQLEEALETQDRRYEAALEFRKRYMEYPSPLFDLCILYHFGVLNTAVAYMSKFFESMLPKTHHYRNTGIAAHNAWLREQTDLKIQKGLDDNLDAYFRSGLKDSGGHLYMQLEYFDKYRAINTKSARKGVEIIADKNADKDAENADKDADNREAYREFLANLGGEGK